jgi:hypothetical protein
MDEYVEQYVSNKESNQLRDYNLLDRNDLSLALQIGSWSPMRQREKE